MGCIQSRPGEQDAARRFNARKRFMKQAVLHRQAFAAAHFAYLLALRNVGIALRRFASGDAGHGHHRHGWTSAASPPPKSSGTPPPPPSPPLSSSSWGIVNPFRPSSPPSSFHLSNANSSHRWRQQYGYYTNTDADASSGANVSAMVTELLDIVGRLEEQFVNASACGTTVSKLLETRKGDFMKEAKANGISASMIGALTNWAKNGPLSGGEEGNNAEAELVMGGHALVLQRLYSMEKKLLQEVKICETLRAEQQKKCLALRTQEARGDESAATERLRVAVKKLEMEMAASYQSVNAMLASVKTTRDHDLHPQLTDLAHGLACMWRTMHECHGSQKQIVLQLKSLECWVTQESTSELHHQSTVELQKAVGVWHECFCKLMSCHRDYVAALTGWCRLSSMMHTDLPIDIVEATDAAAASDYHDKENDKHIVNHDMVATFAATTVIASKSCLAPSPPATSLCEEWQKTIDRLPEKVVSEAIKSLCAVVSGLVTQQTEELKQKRKVERLEKRLEKKVSELGAAEKRQQQQAEEEAMAREASKAAAETDGDEDDYAAAGDNKSSMMMMTVMSSDDDEDYQASEEAWSRPMTEDSWSRSTTEETWSVAESSPARRQQHQQQQDPLAHQKAAVEALKKKVEVEKAKLRKCVQDTRVLTLNNMQTGLPGVFEALTGFSAVFSHAFQALSTTAPSNVVQ